MKTFDFARFSNGARIRGTDPVGYYSMMSFGAAMTSVGYYVAAALTEIAGCFAFWAWLRLDKSPIWVGPGIASLVLFAYFLTRISLDFAGRAYAAYGGIYIAGSLAWLWLIEGRSPDRWDAFGAAMCLVGAGVILLAPHGSR